MSIQTSRSSGMQFVHGLYPLGVTLVLFPLADFASRFYPLNTGNLQWRFAAVGLALSSLTMLLIGVSTVSLTAALREHRGVLRAMAVFAWIIAAAIVAAGVLFSLDALQLRARVNPALKTQFMKAALSAAVAGALHFVGYVGVGLAAWRAGRQSVRSRRAASAEAGAPIVIRELEAAGK